MTKKDAPAAAPSGLDVRIAQELVEHARRSGVALVGEGGLLAGITRTVLQTALEAEMAEHLGYDKGEAPDGAANHRNGTTPKTVHTEIGPVRIAVPRDRAGTFEPEIVPKHARRVPGFDDSIISLYAKGLTTGEIQAHLAEIYDVEVSRDLISKVTDRVHEELIEWQNRPLDGMYPVIFIDCIHSQDPRRPGREPAGLCRGGHRPGRPPRRARPVGRLRR